MEIPEINAYKERSEKEFLDMLSYRKGILAQIASEENELEIAKHNKEVILQTNFDLMSIGEKEVRDFKKQKEDFVNNLDRREKNINKKEKLLNELIEKTEIRSDLSESAKKEYNDLILKVKEYEKTLKEKIKEQEDKNKEVERIKNEARKVWEINEVSREELRKDYWLFEEDKSVFNKEKEQLELEKEMVKRQKEQIIREKEAINKDRLHLYSQQETLKLAYEECKNKGII